MKKLNLGCGLDIRQGYINLDMHKLNGVDIVHDVNNLPLPFSENEFDYILCQDVLEHVDNLIGLMKELNRVIRKDGIVEIRVPHFTSANNYADPTHKNRFSVRTFYFFTIKSRFDRNYYFDFAFESIEEIKLTYSKKIIYNIPFFMFFNLNIFSLELYENTFFSRIFPAVNLVIKLRK